MFPVRVLPSCLASGLRTLRTFYNETLALLLTLSLIAAPQSLRSVPAGCSPGARNRLKATEASTSPTSRHHGGTAWRCAPSSTARGPNSCRKAHLSPCDGVVGYSDLDPAGLTPARQTVTCLRLALTTPSRSKLNKGVFIGPVEGARQHLEVGWRRRRPHSASGKADKVLNMIHSRRVEM